MSMPGSFNAPRRPRAVSEDQVLLPLTSDGDDDEDEYEDEDGIQGGELGGEEEDDLDDEDDEDAEYIDEGDIEEELFMEYDDDEDDDDDGELELEFEEDDGMNVELGEAERMAQAAEVANDASEPARPQAARYTLAIDPATNGIYIVDSEGTRRDITGTGDGEQTDAGQTRRSLTADATLAALRRMLGRSRPVRSVAADDDDDDDDEDGLLRYGYSGGRRNAQGLFPKVTQPVQAGVDLERKGLFGRPGKKYETPPQRRFSPYSQNLNDTMRRREYRPSNKLADRMEVGDAVIPNSPGTEVAQYDNNVYCGQYSKDGTFFYTCAQDYMIRIYDMTASSQKKSVLDSAEADNYPAGRRYRGHRFFGHEGRTSLSVSKTVQAPEYLCQWTITDANLSPDNSKMIWSTIGPVVGMTRFKEGIDDLTNLDEGDDQVQLDFGAGRAMSRRHFGIWSIRFSADGREIVAGAGSGAIHVYDLEARRTILSIQAHEDDVNAVCFADTASSNVLVSGSDDNYLKVWDRRSLGEGGRFTKPSGVLVGHTEGVTFVAPKGDGRFVISNAKDQTCKLWDLRMMYSGDEYSSFERLDVSVPGFDYRYGLYRKPRYAQHPRDRSLMTYTGHTVLRTLIRCHFSPEATTGQRYIYSGSHDGRIHIWNLDGTVASVLDRTKTMPLLTRGATSNQIRMNDPTMPDRPVGTYPTNSTPPVIRDVSWAPYAPNIMSSAWTEQGGSVAMHEWKGYGKRQDTLVAA